MHLLVLFKEIALILGAKEPGMEALFEPPEKTVFSDGDNNDFVSKGGKSLFANDDVSDYFPMMGTLMREQIICQLVMSWC